MASPLSDASAVAAQLVAAVAAARRMGYVPVVGLMTADQIADLSDAAQAAHQVLDGMASGSTTEGDEEADDVVVMEQPVVVGAAEVGSPPVGSPTAHPHHREDQRRPPPEDLAPLPSSPASVPASGTTIPAAPSDYFIDAATRAKAASLLASRADTWQVAALTSMPSSGTATPARSAARGPPNAKEIFAATVLVPPRRLLVDAPS
ncbi:unnamed protein product [Symbiodinium sp. CCMP2592]|nr:unnamed protein product [Symbiodinium sp. CCMP2592]